MNERTALDVADHLEYWMGYPDTLIRDINDEECVSMLRHQHAEIARLKAIAQRLRDTMNDALKEMSPQTRDRPSYIKLYKALIEIPEKDVQ